MGRRRLAMYGPGLPSRWKRWTPAGRRTMRELLTEHLAIVEKNGASPEMAAQIRAELRHYGG